MPLADSLEVNVVRIPLVGRPSARVAVGTTINVEHSVVLNVFKNDGDAAIITKESDSGGIIVTDGAGEIYFELTAPEVALLNPQRLYRMRVDLLSDETDIVYSRTYVCYPTQNYFSESYPMSALLSTRFLNTLPLLGEAGGVGYLDGITTVNQTVGCQVQFKPADSQPEQWTLEASTAATVAGVTRRPLDYASDNQKVWRKIS